MASEEFCQLTGIPAVAMQPSELSDRFERYTQFDPEADTWSVTPGAGGVIQRFYDSSPLSPSGRYLALVQFPFENKSPRPGDVATVLLTDLASGIETILAETRGWDTQLGAQVQWGMSDSQLFFNDLDRSNWRPFGVRLDPFTGERFHLEGSVYNVSPDGKWAISPCLRRSARTQLGYGVMVPPSQIPQNNGAPADDGIWLTSTVTGESKMLISLKGLVEKSGAFEDPSYRFGDFYAFHTKWSPDGKRIMLVLRWTPKEAGASGWWRFKPASKTSMRKNVITLASDGSDIRVAVSDTLWSRGGHHPNWCPDSDHIVMNLDLNGDGLRFVQVRHDGSDLRALHPTALGSGHPSVHPGGRILMSDAYPKESVAYGDGSVPIRLINLETGNERRVLRINCRPKYVGDRKEMRVDAHPAWSRDGNWITFNGTPDGRRRVFMSWVGDILNDI